jgi:hypothetical protein
MVLATEMSKHFEHLNKFVNKFSVSHDEKSSIPVKVRILLQNNILRLDFKNC